MNGGAARTGRSRRHRVCVSVWVCVLVTGLLLALAPPPAGAVESDLPAHGVVPPAAAPGHAAVPATTPQPTATPTAGPPDSTPGETSDGDGGGGPLSWLNPLYALDRLIAKAINTVISSIVGAAMRPLLELLRRTFLATPHLADDSGVRHIWRISLGIADSLLVLTILIGAATLMGYETIQSKYAIKDMAPRLLVAAIASNLSLRTADEAIEISNSLSTSLLVSAMNTDDPAEGISRFLMPLGTLAVGDLYLVLLAAAALIVVLLIIIGWISRIVTLVVVIGVAPIALLCHALPQTESFAYMWWRYLIGLLLIPVAQTGVLVAAVGVFTGADGTPASGIAHGNSVLALLVIFTLLLTILRVPKFVSRTVMQRTGELSMGKLLKYAVIHEGVRHLRPGR